VRTINTTSGPVEIPKGVRERVVNTSRVVEEDLRYEDEESEILAVIPATGWQAVVEGEIAALVAFVAMDDGKMYGVAVDEDGLIDLTASVEERPGFAGYEQVNNDKEK
jgi:hypothetical protein